MEGEEGKSFLQGFVTGDMEEERGVGRALYSMMLNAQVRGREGERVREGGVGGDRLLKTFL